MHQSPKKGVWPKMALFLSSPHFGEGYRSLIFLILCLEHISIEKTSFEESGHEISIFLPY